MAQLFYISSKHKKIMLTVTRHALVRFIERFKLIYSDESINKPTAQFSKMFNESQRVKNLSRKEKIRIKRHGATLFFRKDVFTFVVKDCNIVTVEVSDKCLRYLNRKKKERKILL